MVKDKKVSKVESQIPTISNECKIVRSIQLLENENLEYHNIQLQKQMLSMQMGLLNKQETDWIRRLKDRTNIDVTGWDVDINASVCLNNIGKA